MIELSKLPEMVGKSIPRPFLQWLIEAFTRINNKLDILAAGSGNVPVINSDGELEDTGKAVPGGSFVGTSDTQTLTNKTLTTPTIANFTNSQHDHADAAGGGEISLDYAWPIGIETTTVNDVNPSTLGLPGTWEEV